VYDEFVNRVVDKVRALRQGPPAGAGSVDVGSLAFPPQVGVVEQHVRDAVVKGAEVLVGGSRGSHNGGYWFEPTVLTDVTHDMECMREETFGPTLPIMRVRDVEDAIRLANDSPYGLSAAVFSRDIHRAEAVARRLEAGTVTINDALVNYTALELPMGGGKPSSGIGRRHGAEGIRKYCAQQSLLISRFHLRHDIHTHPYSARKTRMLGWLLRLVYGRARRR
jgi:acyl-CoA reductase-like NAD-dependent aldehyde dehydrogenase